MSSRVFSNPSTETERLVFMANNDWTLEAAVFIIAIGNRKRERE